MLDTGKVDYAMRNRYGGNALIPACERGHVDTVRLLLDRSKIDVNHINNLGWTALLEAVILSDGGPRHIEIVRLLLAAGADPNIADNDGVVAAAARPRPPLRRDRRADPDAAGSRARTYVPYSPSPRARHEDHAVLPGERRGCHGLVDECQAAVRRSIA